MTNAILKEFERSGHSIKWLSDETGIPYAAVHRFVRGQCSPVLTTAEKMCRVLGLELKRKPRRRTTKGAK